MLEGILLVQASTTTLVNSGSVVNLIVTFRVMYQTIVLTYWRQLLISITFPFASESEISTIHI